MLAAIQIQYTIRALVIMLQTIQVLAEKLLVEGTIYL